LGFILNRLLATSGISLGAHVSTPSNAKETDGRLSRKNKRQLAIRTFFPKVKIIMIDAGLKRGINTLGIKKGNNGKG
jgi:hypothetical protein